jgi:hypothetical protein
MTRQLDVDRVLEDWLAEGPSRLSDDAIRDTIAHLDDIAQRKRTWLPGSERMNRLILSATGIAAAAIVAVVALGTLNGNGDPGGPTGVPFTSERHGYTVVLPANEWRREERPGTWELGAFFEANTSSGVDYYERLDATPTGTPTYYVYLASQPIPFDMPFADWAAGHDAANAREVPCFRQVGTFEDRSVDGETARVGTHTCDDWGGPGVAWTTVQTLVIHNERGYAIYVWPFGDGDNMPPLNEIQAVAADWLSRFSFND